MRDPHFAFVVQAPYCCPRGVAVGFFFRAQPGLDEPSHRSSPSDKSAELLTTTPQLSIYAPCAVTIRAVRHRGRCVGDIRRKRYSESVTVRLYIGYTRAPPRQ